MVEHVRDVPAMVGLVVDYMKQHVTSGHGSGGTVHELEVHDLMVLGIRQPVGVVDVPPIDFHLRSLQLYQCRYGLGDARSEAMWLLLKVSLPNEVYDVGMVECVHHVAEASASTCHGLALGKSGKCAEEACVGPSAVAREHADVSCDGHEAPNNAM